MTRRYVSGILVLLVTARLGAEEPMAMNAEQRKSDFVTANIVATHAYQVGLHRKQGKGDKLCWKAEGVSDADLQLLVDHQRALLAEPPEAVRAWAEGHAGAFDPARDLRPLCASPVRATATNLPVNVLTEFLTGQPGVSPLQARALAGLLQMMLDVDRDGERLQSLFAHYVQLGLPVHTAQLGLAARTDEEFLALAQTLAPRFAAAPFDTDAVTLRMMFRKLWTWGHRYTGERDKAVLARELLSEPDVAGLVPALGALPAQKIAVIGHSYTMNVHWASPSAFVPVAAEVFGRVNPKVEVRQWQAGGMNPSRADCRGFYREALAWKPNRVLLVVACRVPADTAALEEMAVGFARQGAEVAMFDSVYGALELHTRYYWNEAALRDIAAKTGMKIIPAAALLNASPDKARFVALDGIHMTEPYHRLMASIWLRFLVGAGTARISP